MTSGFRINQAICYTWIKMATILFNCNNFGVPNILVLTQELVFSLQEIDIKISYNKQKHLYTYGNVKLDNPLKKFS